MGTARVEAFSDGVIAIIVTIMVLELKTPDDAGLPALQKVIPGLIAYLLSFIVVAIMWMNHHHLLHAAVHAGTRLLWANNNLLFWMSLIPFATAYLGRHYTDPLPAAVYGAVLTMCGLGFTWLREEIVKHHSDRSVLRMNRGLQRKNWFTIVLYATSVPLAFYSVYLSFAIFVLIPIIYLIPTSITGEAEKDAV